MPGFARATSRSTLPSTPSLAPPGAAGVRRALGPPCCEPRGAGLGRLIGLTLPMAAPARYRGLLVMNTCLATAEEPLAAGFVRWRAMCRDRPDFRSRASSLVQPADEPKPSVRLTTRRSPRWPTAKRRRAFPEMVPEDPVPMECGIARGRQVLDSGVVGPRDDGCRAQDPVFTPLQMERLRHGIRGCPPRC